MVTGIRFIVPQACDNLLWKILIPIDPSNYFWFIDKNQTEVWNEDCSKDFFEKEIYNGNDFLIQIKSNHKLIFLKAIADSTGGNVKDIITYQDFLSSKCELILLIYDCEFVEVYAKSFELLNSIKNNAIELGFKDICYVNSNDNHRVIMNVL